MASEAISQHPAQEGGHRGSCVDAAEDGSKGLLVAVALYRSRIAFEELFDRFAGRIYGLGMKIAGNDQIAKDLVQDVMLNVWQNANDFDMDRGTAQSWIFAMSRNRCIDMLRRTKRHAVQLSADDIWPDYPQAPHSTELDETESEVALLAELAKIDHHLNRLPAAQREAVKLVYIEDLNHVEASLRLNIPLGTFKSRLRLGLSKLRKLVKARHV